MTAPLSDCYDSMTENELMDKLEALDFDDFFTIDMYILPRLREPANISKAERMSFHRYHTYGDCI